MLHAAAWTDVDGAEDDPQEAAAVNVGGTRHVAELGAPLVHFSTDYVFDGRKPSRTSSRTRPIRSRPTGGRSCTARAPPATTRGSFAARGCSARPATTSCGRCSASARNATRSPSSTTSALSRPTSAISPRRRASSSSCPFGIWHVAADGDCTWAEFAEAIFEEAGLDARVRRITSAELGRPAPRPAYSVLRSEKARAGASALAGRPAGLSRLV